jgi:hypothetical protein
MSSDIQVLTAKNNNEVISVSNQHNTNGIGYQGLSDSQNRVESDAVLQQLQN